MSRSHAIGAAAAIAVAIAVSAASPAGAQPYQGGQGGFGPGMMGGGGYGPGYMGGQGFGPGMMGGGGWGPGMMGGEAFNRPVYEGWGGGVLDYTAVQAYLQQGDDIGVADPKTNTVTFTGQDVTIDMVAVQPGHDDQTFEVHGLTNPTLVVPLGAQIHLNLVNMDYGDNMEHGVILTPTPPPYPYMSMMATGPGLAALMPLLPWRSDKTVAQAQYSSLGISFVAREAGTYWYVCPTPDHAEEGMYGKFIVRSPAAAGRPTG